MEHFMLQVRGLLTLQKRLANWKGVKGTLEACFLLGAIRRFEES